MALIDIPNKDKTVGLFKNFRLEIFACTCVISKVALRNIFNEDKTTGLIQKLRLQIFASPCVIS